MNQQNGTFQKERSYTITSEFIYNIIERNITKSRDIIPSGFNQHPKFPYRFHSILYLKYPHNMNKGILLHFIKLKIQESKPKDNKRYICWLVGWLGSLSRLSCLSLSRLFFFFLLGKNRVTGQCHQTNSCLFLLLQLPPPLAPLFLHH
jgi:hypothetical protein